jgi:hypothetical protein
MMVNANLVKQQSSKAAKQQSSKAEVRLQNQELRIMI